MSNHCVGPALHLGAKPHACYDQLHLPTGLASAATTEMQAACPDKFAISDTGVLRHCALVAREADDADDENAYNDNAQEPPTGYLKSHAVGWALGAEYWKQASSVLLFLALPS